MHHGRCAPCSMRPRWGSRSSAQRANSTSPLLWAQTLAARSDGVPVHAPAPAPTTLFPRGAQFFAAWELSRLGRVHRCIPAKGATMRLLAAPLLVVLLACACSPPATETNNPPIATEGAAAERAAEAPAPGANSFTEDQAR